MKPAAEVFRSCQAALAIAFFLAAVLGCSKPTAIKIGFMGSMSGNYTSLGQAGRNGLTLAIEEQNAKGGIHGAPIELVISNDAQDGSLGVSAAQELLSSDVKAIVGPMTSINAKTILPLMGGLGIPLVSPTATSTELEGKNDALFRVMSSDPECAMRLANYAYKERGVRKVSIFLEAVNLTYSQSLGNAFAKAFSEAGGEVVSKLEFTFEQSASDDYVRAALRKKPDAVFFVGNAVSVARVAILVKKLSPKTILMGDSVDEELMDLGGGFLDGFLGTQSFDRTDSSDRFQKFSKEYIERFKGPVSFGAVAAYDAGKVVIASLLKQKAEQTLLKAMEEVGEIEGLQEKFSFDQYGDAHRKAVIVTIENNAIKVIH